MGRSFRWGVGDVLVGGLLLALLGTATLTAAQRSREIANRAKCASNLHQIGLAILLYQQDNQQLYPRTVMEKSDDPKPTWETPYADHKDLGPRADADPFGGKEAQPAVNDVSAALFLLMRNEQITSEVFVCPSSKATKWDFGGGANTALNWVNWQGAAGLGEHLSYSYQNPYVGEAAIKAGFNIKNPDPTFATAADMNPGGEAVTKVTMRSPPAEMRKANSLNHDQAGQNVLYGDGHAEWQGNPFVGTQHDNVYTAAGPELNEPGRGTAAVARASVTGTDSVLLPAAAGIGYTPPPPPVPLTAATRDKMKADLPGKYAAKIDGEPATLTIDAATITCETGPVTIRFDYAITGDNGTGLNLKLTAPNTNEEATVVLKGESLTFDGGGRYALDFAWKKVPAGK